MSRPHAAHPARRRLARLGLLTATTVALAAAHVAPAAAAANNLPKVAAATLLPPAVDGVVIQAGGGRGHGHGHGGVDVERGGPHDRFLHGGDLPSAVGDARLVWLLRSWRR